MKMVAKVGEAMQRLFGAMADEVAKSTKVIKRQREFTPMSLAMTFVLGYLWKPQATIEELASMASDCGVNVSPQAVDQRRTETLVEFLKQLLQASMKISIASTQPLSPILDRFTNVTLLDSSIFILPDSLKEELPGCGGSHGQGQAAMKLQTELDLRHGALSYMAIEEGKSSDGATCRQKASRGAGSLRISDLGYFNISIFAAMAAIGEYFLSRLQFGTGVLLANGTPIKVREWVERQADSFIDCSILLGVKDRLPCRMIAWRVPAEIANRRRQKLRAELKSRKGKEPSQERLAWCDWSILVTNVPPDQLSPKESVVLYRARWQIELLFKRWKARGLAAALIGSTDTRKMVGIWARLLACVVQHWLLVTVAWGNILVSLDKAGNYIRHSANRIAVSLIQDLLDLTKTLTDINRSVNKTCRRNKRRKPGTFELLNNPELLNFQLS